MEKKSVNQLKKKKRKERKERKKDSMVLLFGTMICEVQGMTEGCLRGKCPLRL